MFKMQDSNADAPETKNPNCETIQNPKSKIQNQNIRVLLWDIDGTLIQSTRGGDWTKYFAPAMKEIYGSAGTLEGMSVSGMTDSQIVCEALKDEGISTEKVFSKFGEFTKILAEKMARYVSEQKESYRLLAGVKEILEAVSDNSLFLNALLTGNFTGGAKIKLKYFDLWKYFADQPNTFGETSHDRRALAKTAVKNINNFLGSALSQDQFVVIGDTPNDIKCARSIGAKVIAVATGRNNPAAELETHKPDCVLEDLSDTKKVLRVLETV